MAKFKVGDRVLWVFGEGSDTGTIIKKNCEHSSLWLIRWDSNGRVLPASEENLSLLKERNTPWYETEEGKQWLSEQMDVEEAFNKSQEDTAHSVPTYSIGQRFKVFYEEGRYWDCILAQVFPFEVCLIDINSGNRIEDPIRVKDIWNITTQEMKEMSIGCEVVLK